MKHISLLFLLTLLVVSCTKDKEPDPDDPNLVENRQSVDVQVNNFSPPRTYEGLKGCYDQVIKDDEATFNEKFGDDISKSVYYISKTSLSQVVPLFKGEQVENLLWINERFYFLINRNEELDSEGHALRTYSKLFQLSKTDYLTGSTSLLGGDFVTINSDIELRVIETTKSTTPDQVYAKAAQGACSQWEDEWLLLYYNFLGLTPPIGGDLPPDVIEFSTMQEIINSVTGGACICPLPCLVVQALNEHPDVQQTAKDLANQNYVVDEYSLDPFFPIDLVESDLLSDLVTFACRPIVKDPCTGDALDFDIIRDALTNPNGVFPNVTLEEFYAELNKEDYIILDESFTNNDKVNCVWNTIINSHDDLMCNTLSNFFGGTKINLYLYVQDFGVSTALGFTSILESGGFSISINQDFAAEACEVEILKTILHEAIHAEILRRLTKYTIAEQNVMFPVMMSYFNDPDVDDAHHEYMAQELFGDLLAAVISFYPGYTLPQYEAMVWSGLHNTQAFDDSGLTSAEITTTINNMRSTCNDLCD